MASKNKPPKAKQKDYLSYIQSQQQQQHASSNGRTRIDQVHLLSKLREIEAKQKLLSSEEYIIQKQLELLEREDRDELPIRPKSSEPDLLYSRRSRPTTPRNFDLANGTVASGHGTVAPRAGTASSYYRNMHTVSSVPGKKTRVRQRQPLPHPRTKSNNADIQAISNYAPKMPTYGSRTPNGIHHLPPQHHTYPPNHVNTPKERGVYSPKSIHSHSKPHHLEPLNNEPAYSSYTRYYNNGYLTPTRSGSRTPRSRSRSPGVVRSRRGYYTPRSGRTSPAASYVSGGSMKRYNSSPSLYSGSSEQIVHERSWQPQMEPADLGSFLQKKLAAMKISRKSDSSKTKYVVSDSNIRLVDVKSVLSPPTPTPTGGRAAYTGASVSYAGVPGYAAHVNAAHANAAHVKRTASISSVNSLFEDEVEEDEIAKIWGTSHQRKRGSPSRQRGSPSRRHVVSDDELIY